MGSYSQFVRFFLHQSFTFVLKKKGKKKYVEKCIISLYASNNKSIYNDISFILFFFSPQ